MGNYSSFNNEPAYKAAGIAPYRPPVIPPDFQPPAQGAISPYAPSPAQAVHDKIRAGAAGLFSHLFSKEYAGQLADRAAGPVDALTPVGAMQPAFDAGRDFGRARASGDWRGMGLAGLGLGVAAASVLPWGGAERAAAAASRPAMKGLFGNLMKDESGAIRAWHGSPHDFDLHQVAEQALHRWTGRSRSRAFGAAPRQH